MKKIIRKSILSFNRLNAKKMLIAATLAFTPIAITGCGVTINVEKPDGTKYSYKRRGDQKLENVTFKTPEGAEFSIGQQESTDLSQALSTINTLIEKVPIPPILP